MTGLAMKVNYDTQTVSARELYTLLEVTDRFSRWFERMTAYGFLENEDFTSVKTSTLVNNGAKRELQDFEISVDMAKHICMVQRTEKAKDVRQYLIDLEKAWNTPEQVMARALKLADKTIDELKTENATLLEDTERMKPKEIFADAVTASDDSILVGDLAKLISQNGIQIGQKRLFEWLRQNGYLVKKGTSWNMPTQKSMNMGLFEVNESVRENPDGSISVTRTPKITGKAQAYFVNKFMKEAATI